MFKVLPIAYDSFSTRSMATLLKIGKTNMLLDPGIAIAPYRNGLKPTNVEIQALEKGRKDIIREVKKCKYIFISHYHFDHHPFYDDKVFNQAVYKGKIVFVKSYLNNINFSQQKRSMIFRKLVKNLANNVVLADSSSTVIEGADIIFSEPVWHGPENTKLGYVVMLIAKKSNQTFIFAPDVQGPVAKRTTEIIVSHDPKFLIVGGPPTYMLGYRFSLKDLKKAKLNLKQIMTKTQVKNIIIDHHLLRDINYKDHYKDMFAFAEHLGIRLMTAAEYLGKKNLLLEAHRGKIKTKNT